MNKRRSHRDALRALLADGREHHQRECLQVAGYRYGARIFELRHDEGLDILTIRLQEDEFAYQLVDGQQRLAI
jgi:hypothetical protein